MMMMTTIKRISMAALVLLGCVAGAEVKLPAYFSDHMVFQRNRPLSVWGTADPGERVEVKFGGEAKTVAADASGNWTAAFPARPAGGPFALEVQASNRLRFDDVMVGELWLASGQSNMSVPTWMSFFFLGTCLFAYYHVNPDPAVAAMEPDQVLPTFLLSKAPPFLGGVIISACLAAAMSSLDSSINAISTVCTVDFVKRFGRKREDASCLKIAKSIACVAAAVMIGGALLIHFVPKESMNDFGIITSSMFGGGMLGIFLLGFFTRRVGNRAVVLGTATAIAFNFYLMLNTFGVLPAALSLKVHSYWTTILVNFALIGVSYLLSFAFPNTRNLDRLTVWTRRNTES